MAIVQLLKQHFVHQAEEEEKICRTVAYGTRTRHEKYNVMYGIKPVTNHIICGYLYCSVSVVLQIFPRINLEININILIDI